MHSSGDEFKVASLVIFSCRWGFVSPHSENVAGHVDLLQVAHAGVEHCFGPIDICVSARFPGPPIVKRDYLFGRDPKSFKFECL